MECDGLSKTQESPAKAGVLERCFFWHRLYWTPCRETGRVPRVRDFGLTRTASLDFTIATSIAALYLTPGTRFRLHHTSTFSPFASSSMPCGFCH